VAEKHEACIEARRHQVVGALPAGLPVGLAGRCVAEAGQLAPPARITQRSITALVARIASAIASGTSSKADHEGVRAGSVALCIR
jgi:hypothetical protein